MAAKLGSPGGEFDENHEINVTPFIDVMLVLLIIFMVAAPLSTVDVKVDLPSSTAPASPRPDKPLFLSVKADLSLILGETQIDRQSLAPALDEASQHDTERRVFLRADQTVAYGDLMDVMNALRRAGYLKVGLVAQEMAPAPTGPTP